MCLSDHFESVSTGFTCIFGESFFVIINRIAHFRIYESGLNFIFYSKRRTQAKRRTLYFVQHQNYFKNSNQNACDINNSKLCWWYMCATDWCNKCRQNTILIRKDWLFLSFILSIGTQIDHICALNVHVCLNGISSIWIIDSILKWK